MSYMRLGYILKYFKNGKTESYVYPTSDEKGNEVIEDYGDDYKNNKSFCELIGNLIRRATGNEKYAWKIVKILAKKLKIDKDLRDKPLTFEEYFELNYKKQKN